MGQRRCDACAHVTACSEAAPSVLVRAHCVPAAYMGPTCSDYVARVSARHASPRVGAKRARPAQCGRLDRGPTSVPCRDAARTADGARVPSDKAARVSIDAELWGLYANGSVRASECNAVVGECRQWRPLHCAHASEAIASHDMPHRACNDFAVVLTRPVRLMRGRVRPLLSHRPGSVVPGAHVSSPVQLQHLRRVTGGRPLTLSHLPSVGCIHCAHDSRGRHAAMEPR